MGFYPVALVGAAALTNPVGVTQGGTGLSGAGSQMPWVPSDNGLLAACGPVTAVGTTQVLTVSVLYLRKIFVRTAFTATNVWFLMSAAGSGASSGSFCGLLSSAGTLLSSSSDIGTAITGTAGPVSVPLTTPQALAAGTFVWAAIVSDLATTQPTLRVDSSNAGSVPNLNLAAASLAAASNGTTMATVTPSSNVSAPPFWFGLN